MDQKILDALKTINDKLGGTNDPNENWGSLLQEIAQNVGSGGGGGGGLVVNIEEVNPTYYRMDKTAQEIYAALSAGTPVVAKWPDGTFAKNCVSSVVEIKGNVQGDIIETYYVQVVSSGQAEQFVATEADDWYPGVSYE